jgi:hypothetical protein
MNREEIIAALQDNHASFISYLNTLTEAEFNFTRDDKWTPGQQLDHIIRAVRPLTLGFMLPKFVYRLLYGKANRPSRSYEALVAKYHDKLQAGGRASAPFIPPPIAFAQRAALCSKLDKMVHTVCRQTKSFSEQDLDAYILPHPLLGKLTIREMLYFTAYHVLHHLDSVQKLKSEVVG